MTQVSSRPEVEWDPDTETSAEHRCVTDLRWDWTEPSFHSVVSLFEPLGLGLDQCHRSGLRRGRGGPYTEELPEVPFPQGRRQGLKTVVSGGFGVVSFPESLTQIVGTTPLTPGLSHSVKGVPVCRVTWTVC